MLYADDDADPFDVFHGFTTRAACICLDLPARGVRPVVAGPLGLHPKYADERVRRALREATWVTAVGRAALARARTIARLEGRCSVIPASAGGSWLARQVTGAGDDPVADPVGDPIHVIGTGEGERPEALRMLDDMCRRASAPPAAHVLLTDDPSMAAASVACPRMDVFVGLSASTLGMTLEAAAAGVPVVAAATDGVTDVLNHGVHALLAAPGDIAALGEGVRTILADPDLARSLSQAARQRMLSFTPAVEASRYGTLYRQLVDETSCGEQAS
jgi:hypothetical protein